MSERTPLSVIRTRTRESFSDQERDISVYRFYAVKRGVDRYTAELPTDNGETFSDAITSAVSKNGSASLLDIGCGEGVALRELKELHGSKLRAVGLTAYDYRSDLQDDITYLLGDAHDLRSLFPSESFDVIVSVCATMYMADPWRVVKGSYHLLRNGGKAFLKMPPVIDLNGHTTEDLESYWESQGIYAKFAQQTNPAQTNQSLILKKGVGKNIPIPIRYHQRNPHQYVLCIPQIQLT